MLLSCVHVDGTHEGGVRGFSVSVFEIAGRNAGALGSHKDAQLVPDCKCTASQAVCEGSYDRLESKSLSNAVQDHGNVMGRAMKQATYNGNVKSASICYSLL
jgi:hypothetical protein